MVVDASVAVKWVLNEIDSDAALELLRRPDLGAPDLVLVEAANVFWKAWRRGTLPGDAVSAALDELPKLFNYLRPVANLISAASRIAVEIGHPVYDCLYVAAALEDGGSLVTADRRLIERLAGTVYEDLVFPLGRAAS